MVRLISNFCFLLALVVSLGGCAGYELGAVKPSALAGINTINVPLFKNETLEPRISSLVTNAVIKQMQVDGTYKIGREFESDAILKGQITRIRKSQQRSVRTDTIRSRELGLFLYIRWHLEDPKTGERIGTKLNAPNADPLGFDSQDTLGTRTGYVIGDTVQFVDESFQVGERNAIAVAAEDAAKKLVQQLSEGW